MNKDALRLFRSVLGSDRVVTDPDEIAYYATDISGEGDVLPLCVLRPVAVEQLCELVGIASRLSLPMVPRGGGMSYTKGYLPERPDTVMFDLGALNAVVEINVEDRYAIVQAGCTWATLYGALKEKGLRAPFFGPLSGYTSTVGGAASNNAFFFGSGVHGGMIDSVLGLDVVLADGSLLKTGASAAAGRAPFLRSFGPDMSGIFLGDCGAFGIKAQVTLRVIPMPVAEESLSFAFERFEELVAAHIAVARENIVSEQWGIDPVGNGHLLARGFDLLEGIGYVKDVVNATTGAGKTVGAVASMLAGGKRAADRSGFAFHAVVEGQDASEATRKADRVRRICSDAALKELPNTIPTVTRAKPFRPINALLGPEGENWLPVHGLFPLSRAIEVSALTDDFLSGQQEILARHNITISYLTSALSTAFFIEAMFYWNDRLHAFHLRHVTDEQKKRHAGAEAFAETREQVMKLSRGLVDLWDGIGACHQQLGRRYPYASQLSHTAQTVAIAIKAALDPEGLMNPGVLELGG